VEEWFVTGFCRNRVSSDRIEPVELDRDGWSREYLHATLVDHQGVETPYDGPVLKASAATGHSIQFTCRTTVLRRTRVRIPICISTNTVVRLSVNGKLVRTASLSATPNGRLTCRWLVQNVTRWTEGREINQLKLSFSYDGQPQTPIVLICDPHPKCQPVLIQQWTWRYAGVSMLFFVLAWATLLTLAIVILANLHIKDATFRSYAVLGACAAWIAGLLGVPDLARIPVRAWMRQMFGATRADITSFTGKQRRSLAIVTLAVGFLPSAIIAVRIVQCYRVEQDYRSLIHAGMADMRKQDYGQISPNVFKALRHVPWRPEAQALIEFAVWKKREVTNVPFREIAGSVGAKEVEAAIRSAPPLDHLPFYLDGTVRSNPVSWYASIMIEGGKDDNERTKLVERAIDLLQARSDDESQLQLANLRLDNDDDADLKERDADRLGKLFDSIGGNLMSTHTYLAACDALVGYYLFRCETKEAAGWVHREFSARFSNNSDVHWIRPPQKFLLFYMSALYGDSKGFSDSTMEQAKRAKCLAERKDCDIDQAQFMSVFSHGRDCDFRSTFRGILDDYKDFKTIDGWKKGTIWVDKLDLNSYLEQTLSQGWSY
jgi:hypothetical protein